jgi:predicted amidohydrolase
MWSRLAAATRPNPRHAARASCYRAVVNENRCVAAAQTVAVRGDVTANVREHLRLAELASGERAEVLVFPELSLTGYEIELADGLAFSERDPRLTPLFDAAASCALTLVVGAPVRIESRLHIGAFVIRPDRSIDVYTKRRLGAFSASASADGTVPPAERTAFQPGDRDPIVEIGETCAAIAVCADIGDPAHPRAAAARGATIYLASMFVIPSEFESDATRLAAYAAKHSMAVIMANYGGPTGGLASAGKSTVWSERGERLAQLGAAGAGVVIATKFETGWHARTVNLDERR